MRKKTANVLGGFFFMALVAVGFVWLWFSSQTPDVPAVIINYPQVNIESVKQDAINLTSNLSKVSDIPVVVTGDKIGRTNPFEKY